MVHFNILTKFALIYKYIYIYIYIVSMEFLAKDNFFFIFFYAKPSVLAAMKKLFEPIGSGKNLSPKHPSQDLKKKKHFS